MVEGRKNIFGRYRALRHGAADLVCLTDDVAAGHAASGEKATVGLRPVIAAAAFDVLHLRRPAMFADAQHQRFLQQSAGVQVGDQAVPGTVKAGQQFVLHAWVMIPVRVPARAGQPILVPEDGDKARPRLHQPPRRQAGLAEERHTVGLAQGRRFAAKIERLADPVRADE